MPARRIGRYSDLWTGESANRCFTGLLIVASQLTREPVLRDDGRFHSPLRGSAGIAPDFPVAFLADRGSEKTDVRPTIADAHPPVNC